MSGSMVEGILSMELGFKGIIISKNGFLQPIMSFIAQVHLNFFQN